MRVGRYNSVKSEIISALIVMPFICKLLNFANKNSDMNNMILTMACMMMLISWFTSSCPRLGENSYLLCDAFMKGAKEV